MDKKTLEKKDYEIDNDRANFFNSIDKSESDFEHKITYISAGALAITLTFLDKIVDLQNANSYWLLISGWILLAITLSINLISILISRKLTMKSAEEYDNNIKVNELRAKIKKRNNHIMRLDFTSLFTLLSGMFLIVIFCSINLYNPKIQETMQTDKNYEEKGRIIPSTRPAISNPNTGGSSSSGNNNSNSGNSGSSSERN